MFEQVLSQEAIKAIEDLTPSVENFYLAGGTGLALQLGHRKSNDLDFFTDKMFNVDAILSLIQPDKIFFTDLGTAHFEARGIRVSLLYYEVPLIYPTLSWRGVRVAELRDIAAEKIKAISQRGSKRDFIDLYGVIKMSCSISDVCNIFKRRFEHSEINYYHVVKSLVFFEDAEKEPSPLMLKSGEDWHWDTIKSFFVDNLGLFEKGLDVRL